MGYQAVALKGGYHAWLDRYSVEPKSPPVDLHPEAEDDNMDHRQITPAVEHLLAAKHLLNHRPTTGFAENKLPAEELADGKVESGREAPETETATRPDSNATEDKHGL